MTIRNESRFIQFFSTSLKNGIKTSQLYLNTKIIATELHERTTKRSIPLDETTRHLDLHLRCQNEDDEKRFLPSLIPPELMREILFRSGSESKLAGICFSHSTTQKLPSIGIVDYGCVVLCSRVVVLLCSY